ncbi:MAG TPA: hypothetical protein VE397_16985 [Stellaceae bacterium]|nr:hypothetical protein [Stellaceae bacterium]
MDAPGEQRGRHPINLFIWPSGGASDSGPSVDERDGYNLVHWAQNGMTLWAISDLEAGELREFVRLRRETP